MGSGAVSTATKVAADDANVVWVSETSTVGVADDGDSRNEYLAVDEGTFFGIYFAMFSGLTVCKGGGTLRVVTATVVAEGG